MIAIDASYTNTLRQLPEYQLLVLSHEIAHILNGDCQMQAYKTDRTNVKTTLSETLANRLGAIVHGNPETYFKTNLDFQILMLSRECQEVIMDKKKLCRPKYKDYIQAYATDPKPNRPSFFRENRNLKKWADLLSQHGATDKEGFITDMEKAMRLYEKSKEFATAVSDVERAAWR